MNPTLIEYFAAHETLSDFDGTTEAHFAILKPTFESMAGPFPKDMKDIPAWNATWRSKIRFIRARAMVDEAERIRKESEPKDHVWADMVHPLFGTPEWNDYVMSALSHVRAESKSNATTTPKTTGLSFSEALEAMKQGKKVKRDIPNMASIWIHEGRFISKFGHAASFLPEAVLANDWEILPEDPT